MSSSAGDRGEVTEAVVLLSCFEAQGLQISICSACTLTQSIRRQKPASRAQLASASPHYTNQQDTKVLNSRDNKLVVGVIDCIITFTREKKLIQPGSLSHFSAVPELGR